MTKIHEDEWKPMFCQYIRRDYYVMEGGPYSNAYNDR